MNSRERILLGVLFGILIVGGCGVAFYYLFFQDYLAARTQLLADRAKLAEKTNDLANAEKEQKRLLTNDPRLKDWRVYSAPDLEPIKGGGKHTEQEVKAHLNKLQVEYQDNLQGLLQRHKFGAVQIVAKNIETKTVDSKGGTPAKDKAPVYTRIPFSVQATASYANIIAFLKDFHTQPLLQEVRTLSITKPQTPRENTGPGARDVLDIAMTVELLMVTGAESRSNLIPTIESKGPLVLASEKRNYTDMPEKDPFNGTRGTPLTPELPPIAAEEAKLVLSFVELTMIVWNPERDRWNATFYDQGAGFPEKLVNMAILPELKITDPLGRHVFDGKLVYIDAKQLVLEDKKTGNYIRMRVGDYLQVALEKPLKADELKQFNLTPKKVAVADPEK
jgi:hypothetical protein